MKRTEIEFKLIEEIKNGNELSKEKLYLTYYSLINSRVKKYYSGDTLEDLTYDILLKVFSKLNDFVPNKPFKNLVEHIIYFSLLDKKREIERKEKLIKNFNPTLTVEPKEYDNQKEIRKILNLALEEIRPIEKQMIEMFYFEKKRVREISEMLDINLETVKIYIMRGRKKIKKIIGEKELFY